MGLVRWERRKRYSQNPYTCTSRAGVHAIVSALCASALVGKQGILRVFHNVRMSCLMQAAGKEGEEGGY